LDKDWKNKAQMTLKYKAVYTLHFFLGVEIRIVEYGHNKPIKNALRIGLLQLQSGA
jgi:hypothetical protein